MGHITCVRGVRISAAHYIQSYKESSKVFSSELFDKSVHTKSNVDGKNVKKL